MTILVVDRFAVNRDPAQVDMYRAMEKHFSIIYCSTNEALWLLLPRSDIIFLGIYHAELEIDWGLFVMTCDKPVIIDNADNEEQVYKSGRIGYQWMHHKIFTSRYLPHADMSRIAAMCNTNVMLLPWYISPERKPKREKKTNDVAFICSQYGNRIDIAERIREMSHRNGWTCIVGEYFGPLGIYLLGKSRVSVIECDRKCLTQKYIEASMCETTIVGDIAIYPASALQMYESTFGPELESAIRQALAKPLISDLSIFVSESIFIRNFQQVIDAVLLV